MHVGPIANTNPAYTGIPAHCGRVHPDREIVPTPIISEGSPGRRQFAKVLRDDNQTPYAIGQQARDLRDEAVIYHASQSATNLSHSQTGLLPKLNELLPVTPAAKQSTRIETTHQQVIPATGRSLDLYI
jgi:hypothetical protein